MEQNAKKKQGGSTADAAAQATLPPTAERSGTQRWAPGRYVLTAGKYQPVTDGIDYVAGDVIELKESDAQRLGVAGVIAPEDTTEAKRARARTNEERDLIRAEELRAEADRLESRYKSERADREQEEENSA